MVTYQTEYDEVMNLAAMYLKSNDVDDFKFSIDDPDDFEYTIQYTYNRYFNITIHYISGACVYVVSLKITAIGDDYIIREIPFTNAMSLYDLMVRIHTLCDLTEF